MKVGCRDYPIATAPFLGVTEDRFHQENGPNAPALFQEPYLFMAVLTAWNLNLSTGMKL